MWCKWWQQQERRFTGKTGNCTYLSEMRAVVSVHLLCAGGLGKQLGSGRSHLQPLPEPSRLSRLQISTGEHVCDLFQSQGKLDCRIGSAAFNHPNRIAENPWITSGKLRTFWERTLEKGPVFWLITVITQQSIERKTGHGKSGARKRKGNLRSD